MKESHIRREVYNLLRRLWYWPITQTDTVVCPKCHTQIRPPKGRPDILVLSPTERCAVVEVKALNLKSNKSFPFSAISEEQRKWLNRWEKDQGLGFIALGTVNVPQERHKQGFGRRLWIVEWAEWKAMERLVSPFQDSVPEFAGPGFNKELQEQGLDLSRLLYAYECQWANGCWHVPEHHALWPENYILEREL